MNILEEFYIKNLNLLGLRAVLEKSLWLILPLKIYIAPPYVRTLGCFWIGV